MATLIGRDEVARLVAGGAQLVEVLPAEEYAEDHIPGALSHPLRRLAKEASDLDASRPIIVYCWDFA
jgi:rhodanese-related sulfurtransferase